MTGIHPRRALLQVITGSPIGEDRNIDRNTTERVSKIENLQHSLAAMHKDVEGWMNARRQRTIDAHNTARNIVVPSFVVGDFVVV